MASNSKSIESMEGQNVNLNDDELDFDDETNEHHKSDEGKCEFKYENECECEYECDNQYQCECVVQVN